MQLPPENTIHNQQIGGSPTTARHHNPNSSFENSNGGTVAILVDNKS